MQAALINITEGKLRTIARSYIIKKILEIYQILNKDKTKYKIPSKMSLVSPLLWIQLYIKL